MKLSEEQKLILKHIIEPMTFYGWYFPLHSSCFWKVNIPIHYILKLVHLRHVGIPVRVGNRFLTAGEPF